jgi:hypothetical protein
MIKVRTSEVDALPAPFNLAASDLQAIVLIALLSKF